MIIVSNKWFVWMFIVLFIIVLFYLKIKFLYYLVKIFFLCCMYSMFVYIIELLIIFKLRLYWVVFWKKIIEIFFFDRVVLFVSEKDLWLVNKLWIKRFVYIVFNKMFYWMGYENYSILKLIVVVFIWDK